MVPSGPLIPSRIQGVGPQISAVVDAGKHHVDLDSFFLQSFTPSFTQSRRGSRHAKGSGRTRESRFCHCDGLRYGDPVSRWHSSENPGHLCKDRPAPLKASASSWIPLASMPSSFANNIFIFYIHLVVLFAACLYLQIYTQFEYSTQGAVEQMKML